MNHFFSILLSFCSLISFSQNPFIKGNFSEIKNKEILLKGYYLGNQYLISQAKIDQNGNFELKYPVDYIGAAIVEIPNIQSVIILLNKENFNINWNDINNYSSIIFKNSEENLLLVEGMDLYFTNEKKKAGLDYLIPLYNRDKTTQQTFILELNKLDNQFLSFKNKIPANNYVKTYLDLRILINKFSKKGINKENIDEEINQFNNLELTNPSVIKSGLLFEIIDNYISFVEKNSPNNIQILKNSTNLFLNKIKNNDSLKIDIAEYLFNSFEKRSLFDLSENLAYAMLNDEDCTLDFNRKSLFEQYRKMKIGTTVQNTEINESSKKILFLNDIKTKYKLVVFGASWCNKCSEELPKLIPFYSEWKEKFNLEILYISLDENIQENNNFSNAFPWITSNDFKGWDSPSVKNFYINSTPTMYLLNKDNQILLKPISAQQISEWLKFNNQ